MEVKECQVPTLPFVEEGLATTKCWENQSAAARLASSAPVISVIVDSDKRSVDLTENVS